VSPHLAASQTGVTITLDGLLAAYEKQVDVSDAIVCEGVGGLMVPLADDPELSVLDFARAIALPAIVATHPGLGTISDTRLTVDRLESEGIQVAAVVISGWPEKPSAIELSNLQTLAELPIERWLHIQK
jgi:dethiobiotin synthetase